MKTVIGKSIHKAAALLAEGEVVAIPTETVYGLAANIYNKKAVDKIYRVKQRPRFNPLIVHVADIERAKQLVKRFPSAAALLAKKFWPGPLTIILPKRKDIGNWITGGKLTVAIRVPDHPLTLRLLKQIDFPLAAPSANPFTYISPVKPIQVKKMLDGKISYILDGGKSKKGIESTIIAVEKGRIKLLRQGAITEMQLEAVLNKPVIKNSRNKTAHPGMFKKHYSPHTPLILTDDILHDTANNSSGRKIAVLLFSKKLPLPPRIKQVLLSPAGNIEEAASNLYDTLHTLDNAKFDLIIAQRMPNRGMGKAINDRLQKAAS